MVSRFIVLKAILFIIVIITFSNCESVQQVQSARVRSGFSLGMNAFLSSDNELYRPIDSQSAYSIMKESDLFGYPYYFNVGLYDRVAVNFTGFPMVPILLIYEIGLKVKCFDYGESILFKNVTIAVSGSIYGYKQEWGWTSQKWAGLILSTSHRFSNLDLELILNPYYLKTLYEDNYEDSDLNERLESFNVATGFVLQFDNNRTNRFSFEIKAGCYWKYVFDSHYAYNDTNIYANYTSIYAKKNVHFHQDDYLHGNNYGINCGIAFNWFKKKRNLANFNSKNALCYTRKSYPISNR